MLKHHFLVKIFKNKLEFHGNKFDKIVLPRLTFLGLLNSQEVEVKHSVSITLSFI